MSIRVFCFLAFSVLLVKAFPAKDSLEDLIAVESSPLEVKALGEEPIDSTDVSNSDEDNISTESPEEDLSESSNENETSVSDESSTEENSENETSENDESSTEENFENETSASDESSAEENSETVTASEELYNTEESENSDETYKPDYSEESDYDNSDYEDSEDNNNVKGVPVLPPFYDLNYVSVENGVVTTCTRLVNVDTHKVVSEKCHVSGLSPPTYMPAPLYVGVPHPLLSHGFTL